MNRLTRRSLATLGIVALAPLQAGDNAGAEASSRELVILQRTDAGFEAVPYRSTALNDTEFDFEIGPFKLGEPLIIDYVGEAAETVGKNVEKPSTMTR